MIEPTARDVAEKLNIEYYTSPEDLPILILYLLSNSMFFFV